MDVAVVITELDGETSAVDTAGDGDERLDGSIAAETETGPGGSEGADLGVDEVVFSIHEGGSVRIIDIHIVAETDTETQEHARARAVAVRRGDLDHGAGFVFAEYGIVADLYVTLVAFLEGAVVLGRSHACAREKKRTDKDEFSHNLTDKNMASLLQKPRLTALRRRPDGRHRWRGSAVRRGILSQRQDIGRCLPG